MARTRLMMSKQTTFANDCKEFQAAAQLTSGPHMPSNGDLFFFIVLPLNPQFPCLKNCFKWSTPDVSLMIVLLNAGESPSSSSASDVDNLNKHHGLVPDNKTSLGKAAIVSPQVPSGASGTALNIPARLRPVASRFLRDVCALCSFALAASNSPCVWVT